MKGFYKSSGTGVVAAQKAYLQLPTSAVSGARVGIAFDDDKTTDIATSLMGNGELTMDNAVYIVNGQKVADEFNPKRLPKGVYIVNGQKVMVGK